MIALRRLLLLFLYAFWQGGFLFYTSVVVPIGTEVLGGAAEQGFITRLVTVQMNIWGATALAVWLPILWWESIGRRWLRTGLITTWVLLALLQAVLFWCHAALDRLLDVEQRLVNEPELFYSLHRVYLWTATVQWGLALGTVVALVLVWTNATTTRRSE